MLSMFDEGLDRRSSWRVDAVGIDLIAELGENI
jgi:hypothetical protein